jgi:hypothetical protein
MNSSNTSPFLRVALLMCIGVGCTTPSDVRPASTTEVAPVATTAPKAPSGPEKIEVRRGAAVTVDGRAAPGEWDDAGEVKVEVAPGWTSTVRYKHDGTNLLVAFANLGSKAGDAFVYPEVVLDAKNDGGLVWGPDDWWFHASWADCWSHGSYNDYESCRSEEKPPFEANNYVDQRVAPEWIELQIPLSTVQLTPSSSFRLGFVLTDTRREYMLWPARAQLGIPASWADARAVP